MKIGWVEYNGKKSSSLGVHVSGKGTYNAAELDIASHVVPGRNGDVLISNGRFKNIELTYPAFAPSDFEARVQAIRNWMRSAEGYRRIEDNYDPDHFRMGIAKKVLTFNTSQLNRGANFQMVFDCKPQRFLKSGEEPFAVGEWGPTVLDSGDIVSFDYPNDHGAFKALSASITPTQSLNGYTKPWPGGAGKNLIDDSKRVKSGDVLYIGVEAPKLDIPLKAGTYTASAFFDYACRLYYRPVGGTAVLLFNNAYTHSGTFTITEDGDYQFYFYKNPQSEGELDPEQIGNVQIEAGATSTAWEPYENICPITGQTSEAVTVAGKNLIDDSKRVKSGDVLYIGVEAPKLDIPLKAGTYTASAFFDYACRLYYRPVGGTAVLLFNNAYTHSGTFTITEDGDYQFYFYKNPQSEGELDPEQIGNVQIEVGSTATAYEPYQGQTVTVQLGETVYGGTVDVVSGTLTLTHRMLTIDQNTASLAVNVHSTTGLYYCSSTPIATTDAGINTASGGGLLCDTFNVVQVVAIGNTYLTGYGRTLVFILPDQTIDDVAKARAWLTSNPVTWVYELAEPKTVQLTGQAINTLMGQNNVWASTGEIEAEWGDNPGVLGNPTQFPSRPIIKVMNPTAGATVSIGGQVMTCSEAYSGEVIIDCNQMNIYSENTNLNSKWTGEFPAIAGGNSNVSFTGADSVEVIPNWWEL